MSVHTRLSTSLRKYVPGYVPEKGLNLEAGGRTIAELITEIGLPLKEIKMVMLNGKLASLDAILKDGDRLACFPAVGGG